MPLWAALTAGLFGDWPRRLEWLGLLIGFAGVVVLSREGDLQGTALGTALLIIAPAIWAFGSILAPIPPTSTCCTTPGRRWRLRMSA